MRKVAIINRKGGVGKTTTSLCMAAGLSQRGYRTLLVDLDQQHNCTRIYRAGMEGVATVFDLLCDPKTPATECIQRTESGDIIAGDDWMNTAEERIAAMDSREYLLADALAALEGAYDFCIIDCPPSLGHITKNILVAADEVVVPLLCDGYSADAFENLMMQVEAVRGNRRLNPSLEVAGLLLTQYEARQRISAVYDELAPGLAERHGTRLFGARIRRCVKVREAQAASMQLFDYAPECTAAVDYQAFVDEFLGIARSGSQEATVAETSHQTQARQED